MKQTVVRRMSIKQPDTYAGRFVLYEVEPFGRRDLGFRVAVPTEYDAAADIKPAARLQPGSYQRLCAFESVSEPLEAIDVAVTRTQEVNPVDLAVHDIKRLGLNPYRIGKIDLGDRTAVETLSRVQQGDDVLGVRCLYYPNAGRLYRVSYVLPAYNLDSRETAWEAAQQTFRSLAPSSDPFLEPVEVFRARGKRLLSFTHPARWKREDIEAGDGATAAQLTLKRGDEVRARLRARADTLASDGGPTPEAAVAAGLDRAADAWGLTVRDQPFASEAFQAPAPVFQPHAVYAGYDGTNAAGDPVEVRIVSAITKRAAYTITALCPAEERDALGFMQAKRCFEIVAATLCRPNAIRPYNLAVEMVRPQAEDDRAIPVERADKSQLVALLAQTTQANRERATDAKPAPKAPVQKSVEAAPKVVSFKARDERDDREAREAERVKSADRADVTERIDKTEPASEPTEPSKAKKKKKDKKSKKNKKKKKSKSKKSKPEPSAE